MTRYIAALTAAVTLAAVHTASAQDLADLRKLYDAGQYQQTIAAGTPHAAEDARIAYLVGQSQQKLKHAEAREAYGQLAARPESDAWHFVGESAVAMLASNAGGAVEAANQAVARDESLAEAHFQRGQALGAAQDMAGAAAAFEKASQIDPSWADAHYYAGLAYAKVKRADQVATHFNAFLKLAPQSPSRAEVQSIMRTLGGR